MAESVLDADYYKYMKYKTKYLQLKNQQGSMHGGNGINGDLPFTPETLKNVSKDDIDEIITQINYLHFLVTQLPADLCCCRASIGKIISKQNDNGFSPEERKFIRGQIMYGLQTCIKQIQPKVDKLNQYKIQFTLNNEPLTLQNNETISNLMQKLNTYYVPIIDEIVAICDTFIINIVTAITGRDHYLALHRKKDNNDTHYVSVDKQQYILVNKQQCRVANNGLEKCPSRVYHTIDCYINLYKESRSRLKATLTLLESLFKKLVTAYDNNIFLFLSPTDDMKDLVYNIAIENFEENQIAISSPLPMTSSEPKKTSPNIAKGTKGKIRAHRNMPTESPPTPPMEPLPEPSPKPSKMFGVITSKSVLIPDSSRILSSINSLNIEIDKIINHLCCCSDLIQKYANDEKHPKYNKLIVEPLNTNIDEMRDKYKEFIAGPSKPLSTDISAMEEKKNYGEFMDEKINPYYNYDLVNVIDRLNLPYMKILHIIIMRHSTLVTRIYQLVTEAKRSFPHIHPGSYAINCKDPLIENNDECKSFRKRSYDTYCYIDSVQPEFKTINIIIESLEKQLALPCERYGIDPFVTKPLIELIDHHLKEMDQFRDKMTEWNAKLAKGSRSSFCTIL